MRQIGERRRGWGSARTRWSIALAALGLGLAATIGATPPLGFVVNDILASASARRPISQHVQIQRDADGTVNPWQLQLQVQGETDYYSQHLVLSPGGYSGWHSHPGLLIGAVQSGQIEFFDAHCAKLKIGPGQVFTENDEVHAIKNTGTDDAHLYISYLVKHGAARRIEESAPFCAGRTGIP